MMSFAKSLALTVAAAGALLAPVASPAATLTTLYSFAGGADGNSPQAGLTTEGSALYGTTFYGGRRNFGTVFKFDPTTGVETVVHRFTGLDGSLPEAALTLSGGALYGTTSYGGMAATGGASNNGTVFQIDPTTGAETLAHSFTGTDGAVPLANFVTAGGALYSTTFNGGRRNFGIVFKFDPTTGAETVVHRFTGPDGSLPAAALTLSGGALYGTTSYGGMAATGGASNNGTVFKIDPTTGAETVLHSFTGPDGQAPWGLILFAGVFFGTTYAGGAHGYGAVFKIDPITGAETVLHSFTGGPDGYSPSGSLTSFAGALFGLTSKGGNAGYGTVFKIDPTTGAKTVLHSFAGADGAVPSANLVVYGGALYGTTSAGGLRGHGTLFKIMP